MAFHHSPKIVTDGLVMYLDAANPKSYPGIGSTWHDLSGNNYDGDLTSIVFTDRAIVFDSSTSLCYTSLPVATLGSVFTVCGFFDSRGNDTNTAVSNRLVSCDQESGSTKWCVGVNNDGDFLWGGIGGSESYATPLSLNNSQIYFFAITHNSSNFYSLFLNNVKEADTVASGIAATSYGNLSVGCRPNSGTDRIWDGGVYLINIYTRVLSDSEIIQNYDALKGRFGL